MCVCLPLRLLITSAYDWLNKGYSFYMAAVVIIGDGCGLRIEAHQIRVSYCCIIFYFHFNNGCAQGTRRSVSVVKMSVAEVGVRVLRC